jgi:hypothetical protein
LYATKKNVEEVMNIGRYADREGRISIPVIDEDMSKIKEHCMRLAGVYLV